MEGSRRESDTRASMPRRRLVLIALAIALAYLAVQLALIARLPLVMDEFDGAYEAHQLLTRVPYRDFPPYKTVLGYYLQVAPVALASDPWTGLMLSKVWLALINTACIIGATVALAALFSPGAALASELLLICMTSFFSRSSSIRVDMLTAWAGLFSMLLLLRRRWLLAGVLAGVSFLVSQKGIYYWVAADVAAGAFWLFESRDRRTFRDVIVFNAGAAATVLAYLAFWSVVATPRSVIEATFLAPTTVAFGQLYDLSEYWTRTLEQNPLYYGGALAGFALIIGARLRARARSTHVIAAAYGMTLFALCAWHRQPWPYFFVILIPTLMVVHTASIDILSRQRFASRHSILAAVGIALLLGIAYPLTFLPPLLSRSTQYQRYVVRTAHALLGTHDTYLAGNDLVYDREQTPPALRRLSAFHVVEMRTWPPPRLDALIEDIDRGRPKLLIYYYRLAGLPAPLRSYLFRRYDHWSASIFLYAPLVAPGERTFEIWFDGQYRIEPVSGSTVIDGRDAANGVLVRLQRGIHQNASSGPVRLRLIPDSVHADPAMQNSRALFAGVYDY
jgi:hypothetical protein